MLFLLKEIKEIGISSFKKKRDTSINIFKSNHVVFPKYVASSLNIAGIGENAIKDWCIFFSF